MATPDLTSISRTLIRQEALPDSYMSTVRNVILPLAQHVQSLRQDRRRPILVGINGAQGTGKSTLTLFLKALLTELYRVSTASLSIDDLYLTRAERERLAREQHPLLVTRGVPGTHDLTLGQHLIESLMTASADDRTAIPRFDKSRDDRAPQGRWPVFQGRAEVVLLEGWCVGAQPEESDALAVPVNQLEKNEDSGGAWRRYVNQRLKSEYASFFSRIDSLVMLKAPSMDCVLEWRTLQEHKLRLKADGAPDQCSGEESPPTRVMSDEEVARFIMHYERITRACLTEMPSRADVLIRVDTNHSFSEPLINQRQ